MGSMLQHEARNGFRGVPPVQGGHCHKMIKATAQELAGAMYEELMADDFMFTAWKKKCRGMHAKNLQKRFIARYWGSCIPIARATLTTMLRGTLDEAVKEEIYEALCLDATLIAQRAAGTQVAGSVSPPR